MSTKIKKKSKKIFAFALMCVIIRSPDEVLMTGKEFWEKVDEKLKEQNVSITELAVLLGLSRNTFYAQRNRLTIPKVEQIHKMEKELKCNFFTAEDSFEEYLPYLRQAEEWQLRSVRQILNMPEPFSKSDGSYTTKAN